MRPVTATSHVYRLIGVLAVGALVFLIIRAWAIPPTWNSYAWYRTGDLADLKAIPNQFGANDSCVACHKDISLTGVAAAEPTAFSDEFDAPATPAPQSTAKAVFEHHGLNCESCHGPLSHHVKDGKKIASAVVINKSNSQCMICHRPLISRPADFPQFSMKVAKHKTMSEQTLCIKCHDPHDPIQNAVAAQEETLNPGDEL